MVLSRLVCTGNLLSGSIPSSFASATLPALVGVSLQANALTGDNIGGVTLVCMLRGTFTQASSSDSLWTHKVLTVVLAMKPFTNSLTPVP